MLHTDGIPLAETHSSSVLRPFENCQENSLNQGCDNNSCRLLALSICEGVNGEIMK